MKNCELKEYVKPRMIVVEIRQRRLLLDSPTEPGMTLKLGMPKLM